MSAAIKVFDKCRGILIKRAPGVMRAWSAIRCTWLRDRGFALRGGRWRCACAGRRAERGFWLQPRKQPLAWESDDAATAQDRLRGVLQGSAQDGLLIGLKKIIDLKRVRYFGSTASINSRADALESNGRLCRDRRGPL